MKSKTLMKKLSFIIPIAILLVLSLLNMYGARFISTLYSRNLIRQTIWIIIGIFVSFAIYKVDDRLLKKYSTHFYLLGVASLLLVLFFGINVNGATSWFRIKSVSFQPSELFKFFYILFMARTISKTRKHDLKLFLKVMFFSFIPCILIFLEPDTGVVLMYLLMLFGLLCESKIPWKYTFFIISSGVLFLILFFVLYFFESDLFIELFGTSFFYRIDRILSFKDASSYQISNALIGVGASGLFGFGLKSSKIYVPEVTTDFVFDLTILNFGSIMGIIVVGIYTYILWNLFKEIKECKKQEDKLILSGIFFMMLFQVLEHILMNLGLTPITGITLPFLSYGGSSLLSYFMLFGIVLKITTNNSSYS